MTRCAVGMICPPARCTALPSRTESNTFTRVLCYSPDSPGDMVVCKAHFDITELQIREEIRRREARPARCTALPSRTNRWTYRVFIRDDLSTREPFKRSLTPVADPDSSDPSSLLSRSLFNRRLLPDSTVRDSIRDGLSRWGGVRGQAREGGGERERVGEREERKILHRIPPQSHDRRAGVDPASKRRGTT